VKSAITPILRKLIKKQDWVCALTLSILAALPRLYRLDLAEFKLDEANHYRMAYFLTRGDWRWVGSTSSIGFPKPPLFIYATALPMALSRDPRIITGFLGLLAALAAGAFYLVLRRFFTRRAAFGAALLFAFNPQAVLYARKLFTADLLPPLCTLFLVAGIAFLESSRQRARWMAILVAFTFALLVLTTFSPLLLLPALGLLFLERRRDLPPLHWLGAIAGLVLPFVPYLVAVMNRLPNALTQAGDKSSFISLSTLLNWIWELLYGSPWPGNTLSIAGVLSVVLAVLSLIGLLFLLNQARKKENGRWARFFLAWVCLSPLFALIVPVEIHAHYLVILYPLLFVLPAAGVELAARKASALGWIALLFLGIVAIWQAQAWGDILRAAVAGSEGYGTPLGYWQRAADQSRVLAEEQGAEEVLLLMPGDQPWDAKANILDALLSDTPHRVVNGYTTLLYPLHPAILLIASEVEASATLTFPCTQDLKSDLVASPLGGAYHYRLWSPAHTDASSCTQALSPAAAQWASGVRLLGYDVAGMAQPGGTLHVTLHWETTQGSLEADVHWFNHLEDQAGQGWGQFDLVGWPTTRWQPGDRVLLHFDLSIAPEAQPGPYLLRVGQYTYPDIENIPVVDDVGNPADYAITLPVPVQ
jgi:4-amino-4-deoxy-L-arabinose transferase-like glycosyltransferase